MTLDVSYMGTKRVIAPKVAAVIQNGPPGPLLDLFSGICAVGSAVAPSRQVWSNDIQNFASTVAKAFFTSPNLPLHFDDAARAARQPYLKNRVALETRFARALRREDDALNIRELGHLTALERFPINLVHTLS
ncbi:MAG: DNA adenine methylase [Proteobacteria bacterium]|nr:DNA adenine methylase [Pseudomonadota bacterium]